MISMQRSLSSPVRIHSSPPLSPTVTRVSSRSPTPSPDKHVEIERPRRFTSRSPSRTAETVNKPLPFRRSEETPRRPSASHLAVSNSNRKPVIDQAPPASMPAPKPPAQHDAQRPDDMPVEAVGAASPTQLLTPLLQDASLYSNPHFAAENDSTTLQELAHLVRLSKYQERKRASTRIRLQRSLISTALSARLARCGEIAQRNLADCFRADDKKTFAGLYNAIQDVRKSCDDTRKYALLEPEVDLLQSARIGSSESLDTTAGSLAAVGAGAASISPFLNELSASAREAFLNFLTQIRNNPDYLATRLCSLNTGELAALRAYHQGLEAIDSVLPFHSGSASRNAPSRGSVNAPNPIKRLLSFQRHDPLSALIHTCFANSAGPDSAEDRRRTDIWATAFARLITEKGSAGEPLLISILNAWTSMRDWSGRSNMEWYLMKILEDGAFLLDRAEDQHGTRFNLSDWTSKDQIAADEFYDRATDDLFDVIDDEDATGIPEGLIELGNQVLKRLDSKFVDNTRRWFVYKWLFGVWLLGVVIHPETYGLMAEYHITEYGRQKILKAVALRAQRLVVDMTMSLGNSKNMNPVSTPPKIKAHIENILNRFKGSKAQRSIAKLLPARSITSLRETVEVHPYLVVSPADLVTLVNSLFPERRPPSAHSGSIRSGANSVSGFSAISQPISIAASRNNQEAPSEMSTSASSMASEATTSREPLLEEQHTGTSSRYSPPIQYQAGQKRMGNYEDDGYRLRLAVHDMMQALGMDAVQGACHPCAERWAVLFISPDGNGLSTQMTYDPDDDLDEEENSSTSDTDEDEAEDEKPELDKDYHQLRDSILKLVEDFEIPQDLEKGGSKAQTFSNRATSLKKYRLKNKIITAERTAPNRNPYRRHQEAKVPPRQDEGSPARNDVKGKTSVESTSASPEPEPQPVLIVMLNAASAQSRAQSDFVSAHLYWRTLQQLSALSSGSLRRDGFATLLNIFSRGPRDSIRRSASAIEEYDAWLVWLKQSQERAEGLTETMVKRLRALRDKMWYVTDVRTSGPYEYSRNIAVALKTMGTSRKWNSYQRTRQNMARGPGASYLFRTESQIVDLLAASEDRGGPNKLSDDQAEKTTRWLQQYGIENFCQGEERIHRFCCEVDSCISKLIGESIVDGPVLWSSDLYARDRRHLEGSRAGRDRDSHFWDDSASVVSDPERRMPPSGSTLIARNLRNLSVHNASQQSFDSGRYSFSRASTAMSEILDGQDYFGASSPAPTIDTSVTYWSPFQAAMSPGSTTSRAHSPTTSITNLSASFAYPNHHALPSHSNQSTGRPGTSASSNETVYQQRLSEEKSRFLHELRQTLTSLLLSDLGNLVFARGSETDGWFEGLGQECIERREEVDRRVRHTAAKERRKSNRSSLKQRVIEKKKSFGDLRGATGEAASPGDKADSLSHTSETTASHGGDSSTATSDTVTARGQPSRRDSTPEFPFTKAYQRLLRMFCVHPNPYAKLNALFELEHLIIASLASGGARRRLAWMARSDFASSSVAEEHATAASARARPLEETIDNVKERRSYTMGPTLVSPISPGRGGPLNAETRSIMSVNPANTDAISNVLQSLFRDADIRPKTLFRDMQFIASFVSPHVLDKTERGKAFWDTGLAALSLKYEVCRTMVEVADEVVKTHTTTLRKAPISSNAPPRASKVDEERLASTGGKDAALNAASQSLHPPPSYSLADAARMWTITAKEGNPTSQRELALFYLTNPELVDRTTLPLSKPREVFKQAVMEKYGGSSSGAGRYHPYHASSGTSASRPSTSAGAAGLGISGAGSGPGSKGGAVGDVKSDPALMCVAIHWMEAAEHGGDELARTFLGQNEIAGTG